MGWEVLKTVAADIYAGHHDAQKGTRGLRGSLAAFVQAYLLRQPYQMPAMHPE